MIQTLELFGGIGAPRKAFINLGVTIKAIDYVEIDEKAVRSYNAMFKKDLAYKNQSVVGYNLKPDILIHGSPCQDFSIAGHQKGADKGTETRSSLMWETIHIIEQMGIWKPRVVIWENVKNVLSKHMKHNFNKYMEEMQKLGYTSNYEILNAIDFGLPQRRERVFAISCLDGSLFNFKTLERRSTRSIKDFLENTKEEKYIVSQPSMLNKINFKDGSFGGRVEVIKDYCNTITTKQMRCPNSGVIDLGNGQYRYLTERECWRLQGYSDADFESALEEHPGIKGKLNGTLYKQAGNSIPVPILESIFKQILETWETNKLKVV